MNEGIRSSEPSFTCTDCGFDVWYPVARLSASVAGVTPDGRFPGRCIVVLDHHVEHLEELDPTTYQRFMDDVMVVSRAVRRATGAPRTNVAVLGNKEPHVHAHVFPRGLPYDPVPDRSPWAHPESERLLPATEREALRERVAKEIEESVQSTR